MSTSKKKRNVIIVVVVAIAVALGGVAATRGGKKEEQKSPYRTGKAEIVDLQQKVTEVGTVEPEVKVEVKSTVSGKVIDLYHREGDVVSRGMTLARVEPDLNQAQSLADVKNTLASARIAYEDAKKNFDEDNQLFKQGLLATKSHRDTQTQFLEAKQRFESAREKYAIVEANGIPIGARASDFQGSNVTSPMNGVILTKSVEIGESVTSGVSSFNAGTVLFTVADTSKMIVKAGVNEVDIGKIHLGQQVKVTLDAYPKSAFPGKIDRIAPAVRIDEKVRVFDVEIRLDTQGKELRSGMTANIEVLGEKKTKVLAVPVEGVFQRDNGEVVYVRKAIDPKGKKEKKDARPGTEDKDAWKEFFEKRTVVTGLSDNSSVEVITGLKVGEEIALEDPTLPKERDEDDD